MKKKLSIFCYVLVWSSLLIYGQSMASEEYKIGPGDGLEIRYWQNPALNTLVRVANDGTIAVDIIGKIQASGKTTFELQDEIAKKTSRLDTRISQTVVRVTQYSYQHVFVSGQVLQPGKKGFEEIPDLWTIINEAGGISEFGDLSRVTIIRGGDDAGKVEVVDVAAALASGNLKDLPKIFREDTIELPRSPAGLPSADVSTQVMRKNLIYALGAVARPGPLAFVENTDLLEALALAGGPSIDADLSRVSVITKDGNYAQTMKIDLNKYINEGSIARYIMKREDSFIVERKKTGGFLGIGLPGLAAIAGIVTTGLLIYDQVKTDPVPEVN